MCLSGGIYAKLQNFTKFTATWCKIHHWLNSLEVNTATNTAGPLQVFHMSYLLLFRFCCSEGSCSVSKDGI